MLAQAAPTPLGDKIAALIRHKSGSRAEKIAKARDGIGVPQRYARPALKQSAQGLGPALLVSLGKPLKMHHFTRKWRERAGSPRARKHFLSAAEEDKCKEIVTIGFDSVRVLIVDDELSVRKMLAVMLTQGGVKCSHVSTPEEALDKLQNESFDAVISDLRMGPTSGMDLLEKLHSGYPDVAFLMATGVADVRVGVEAMKQEAEYYLLKPFDMDVVLASLGRALQRKQLEREVQNYRKHLESMVAERTQQLEIAMSQLERSYSTTLEALGSAIDLRDSATAGHARRVLWYSIKLANTLGGLEDQLKNIAMGACLHDIGKLATPDGILLKPGALSDHERWDGSGYPRGLRGDEIPLSARIFAVADTLDAITSDRPYRAALPFSAARDVITRESGKLFDSVVADAFLGIPEESWASISTEAATRVISSVFALSDQSLASTPGFHLPLCFPRLHATPERRDA